MLDQKSPEFCDAVNLLMYINLHTQKDVANLERIKNIIEKNSNEVYTVPNGEGDTALLKAVALGYQDLVELFINNGADVNQRGLGGYTALMKTSARGNIPMMKLLINNGADINIKNKKGETALSEACKNLYPEAVELLVENLADVNIEIRGDFKNPMEYLTCQLDKVEAKEIVKILFDNGYNTNLGMSLLKLCNRNPERIYMTEAIEMFVKRNDINEFIDYTSNEVGHNKSYTPLVYACLHANIEAVELLLKHGANIDIKALQGEKAIDYWFKSEKNIERKKTYQKIIEMILEHKKIQKLNKSLGELDDDSKFSI